MNSNILILLCSLLIVVGCNCFVVEEQGYSRSEMLDFMHILTNKLKEKEMNESVGFVMSYILEQENKIAVVLKDTSHANITKFKESVMDSPIFVFQIGKMDFDEENVD